MNSWIQFISLGITFITAIVSLAALSWYLQNKAEDFSRTTIFFFVSIPVICVLSIIVLSHQFYRDLIGSVLGFLGTFSTIVILFAKSRLF